MIVTDSTYFLLGSDSNLGGMSPASHGMAAFCFAASPVNYLLWNMALFLNPHPPGERAATKRVCSCPVPGAGLFGARPPPQLAARVARGPATHWIPEDSMGSILDRWLARQHR